MPPQGFQGESPSPTHTHCCTLARDCRRGQGRSPPAAKGTAGRYHCGGPIALESQTPAIPPPRGNGPACCARVFRIRTAPQRSLGWSPEERRNVCRPVFMQTPESSPGGAQPCPAGDAAPAAGRRRGSGRRSAELPGPPSGLPSLDCSTALGRTRLPPSVPRSAFSSGGSRPPPVAKRASSGRPRPAAHLPARPAGAPLPRASAEGGLADRARPGASGAAPRGRACPPASQGAPASAVGARGAKPLRPARRPLAAGRAPSAGAAAPPPSPGLARPRCGAARQQAPLWASFHSRPAPGLEGPGPGAEPLSAGRASSAPPPHLQAGPGGAGFLVLSRRGPWRLGAPRASEPGAGGPEAGRRLPGPRPASTLRGLACVPPAPGPGGPCPPEGTAPGDGGLGTREEDRSAFREAGAAARSCGWPEACSPRPWDSGCLGSRRPESGELCLREALLERGGGVGTPRLCETARRALAKRFLSRGHTQNGGCGGQRMYSWAWTSSPAPRAPEAARGPPSRSRLLTTPSRLSEDVL